MSEPSLAPVVDGDWLRAHRGSVVVCDVRWYLDGRSGRAAYQAGHVPGAVFVDLDRHLAAPPSVAAGRHPLPDPAAFAAAMDELGIADGDTVVAYDDTGGSVAARLVWMLRAAGERAAVLDGGMAAWDGPLEHGRGPEPVAAGGGRFTVRPWPHHHVAGPDDVLAAVTAGAAVIDARAPERYRGEAEPVDARPGHVPGATNVPWADNLDPATGRLRSRGALRARYGAAGVREPAPERPPIVYCGSGVTSCLDALALEVAGLGPVRVYVGSWSQWAADPGRPVETGEPG